jgi:hypothetical protein
MDLTKYYRELAGKAGRFLPHYDEARRDYQDAISRTVDGLLFTR